MCPSTWQGAKGGGAGVDGLTAARATATSGRVTAGMVKRYHESFPSFSYGFDSRYPLQTP